MVDLFLVWFLIVQTSLVSGNTDNPAKSSDQTDRMGRSWFSSVSAAAAQLKPNPPPSSTSKPGSNSDSNDINNGPRNFEEQDKTAVPAASEQDFLSRHYGYFNVQRFDPNYPYSPYDRQPYPRYPSPHTPRFGPGYRKDKYGHGYGYSCKNGDDCDEVRAANQIPLRVPHHPYPSHPGQFPHHNSPPTPYNSAFMDPSAFSNLPPYPGVSSFAPFSAGGLYPPAPARFNDPHLPSFGSHHQMPPNRFYHGRYLHDQEDPQGRDEPAKSNGHHAGPEPNAAPEVKALENPVVKSA